ncbi:MAG: hypothetical protein KAT15_06200 [Bacteroidales bacterium]|nr:hypothetical protein [Bacteroidales bacterium]
MRKKSYKVLRWILRGLSGLIIVFLLLMFIGETGESLTNNAILQLSITGIGLIGFALAWKWEFIGGSIALLSFVVIAVINPVVLESSLMFIWPITALLFIVLWALSRNTSVKN